MLKADGETYTIKVKVTDPGTTDDPTPKSYFEVFNLPVRDFDVDWATPYSENAVDGAPQVEVQAGAKRAKCAG